MEGLTGYIATGIVTFSVGLLLKSFEARPKVVFWQPHYALFEIQNPRTNVQSDSISIQNIGRKTAENLEIVFKAKPDNFKFSPPVAFAEETSPNGEFIVKIASLGPKEFLTLQILSHITQPRIEAIRSSAGRVEAMPFRMQRKVPRWAEVIGGFLMLVGFGFTFYWLARAVIFVSHNIGIG